MEQGIDMPHRSRQLKKSLVGKREEQIIETSRRKAQGCSPKYRLNYTTGGWCGKRDASGRRCRHVGTSICDRCLRWSEFEV